MNWYTIRVLSGKEKKVVERLKTVIEVDGFSQYVEEIVAPSKKQTFLKRNKKTERDVVILKGYIFIKCDDNPELFRTINNTPGVSKLSENASGKPAIIANEEMNRMFDLSKKSYEDVMFLDNEDVEVIFGPFKGFNGNISKVDTDKKKATVIVKVFGRETPLDLTFDQIEKIK